MANFQKESIGFYIASAFTLFFAVALQIQTTILKTEAYEGLRINLADFGLPVVGIYILFSLITGRTKWPRWRPPFHYIWPVLLTAVIGFGILHGYYLSGEWLGWALLNKGAGWLILMAYLLCGGWLSTNYPVLKLTFLKVFLGAFFVISAVLVVCLFLLDDAFMRVVALPSGYLAGLMFNRNAYAFLLLVAYIFTTIGGMKKNRSFPPFILGGVWFLLPMLLLFNGSRALWLCFFLLLPFIIYMDWKKALRILLPAFLIGILCFAAFSNPLQQKRVLRPILGFSNLQSYVSAPEVQETRARAYRIGDGYRIDIIKSSLEAWKEHPVLGVGIGYTKRTRIKNDGHLINVIDNSMLWVLTEVGLVGLAVFLCAYIAILLALKGQFLKSDDEEQNQQKIFALCCFVMVLVFGNFSLFHEIIYTRFFWFILGLGLVPCKHLHISRQHTDTPQ